MVVRRRRCGKEITASHRRLSVSPRGSKSGNRNRLDNADPLFSYLLIFIVILDIRTIIAPSLQEQGWPHERQELRRRGSLGPAHANRVEHCDGLLVRLSPKSGAFDQCVRLLQTSLSSCAGFQQEACGDYLLSHVVGLESLQDSDLCLV